MNSLPKWKWITGTVPLSTTKEQWIYERRHLEAQSWISEETETILSSGARDEHTRTLSQMNFIPDDRDLPMAREHDDNDAICDSFADKYDNVHRYH